MGLDSAEWDQDVLTSVATPNSLRALLATRLYGPFHVPRRIPPIVGLWPSGDAKYPRIPMAVDVLTGADGYMGLRVQAELIAGAGAALGAVTASGPSAIAAAPTLHPLYMGGIDTAGNLRALLLSITGIAHVLLTAGAALIGKVNVLADYPLTTDYLATDASAGTDTIAAPGVGHALRLFGFHLFTVSINPTFTSPIAHLSGGGVTAGICGAAAATAGAVASSSWSAPAGTYIQLPENTALTMTAPTVSAGSVYTRAQVSFRDITL